MHPSSQRAVIATLVRLSSTLLIKGNVRVNVSTGQNKIDISYDNRKYIGRIRLELQGDKYLVYMMDKAEGKIATSDNHASKSAYMEITNNADAKLFVKWYILTTKLAAMKKRA